MNRGMMINEQRKTEGKIDMKGMDIGDEQRVTEGEPRVT
jgi:hypothetical protein